MKRAGAKAVAGGSWSKLRAGRASRGKSLMFDVPAATFKKSDAARRFWSERTWSEFAAVPAVSQVMLALTRAGAALEVMGMYTAIADDEVRHAILSRQLADRLGGYIDEIPEGLAYAPQSLAAPSSVPVHVWAMANGCFSETVSLELIRARYAHTTHPAIRAVLAETLKDEAIHVRVAWELAEDLLPQLPAAERRSLYEYGTQLGQMLRSAFGTDGLPPTLKKRERRLRDQTAQAGLGSLNADDENQVIKKTLANIDQRLTVMLRPR